MCDMKYTAGLSALIVLFMLLPAWTDTYARDKDEESDQLDRLRLENRHLADEVKRLKSKSAVAKAEEKNKELMMRIDSMQHVCADYQERMSLYAEQLDAARDTMAAMQHDLDNMMVFRKDFLLNLFRESEEYLSTPYGTMSLARLEDMKSGLEVYGTDPEVKNAIRKIDTAMGYKRTYDSMKAVVDMPLDVLKIREARKTFMNLEALQKKTKCFSVSQWEELDSLDISLSVYNEGALLFQSLIARILEITSQYSADVPQIRQDCIKRIRAEVLDHIPERTLKIMEAVPYLKPRYERFVKWAVTNPIIQTQEIKTIIEEISVLKPTKQ